MKRRKTPRYGVMRLRPTRDPLNVEKLERLLRWPSLVRHWNGREVYIYSGQWEAYWRPGGGGYTSDGLQAGKWKFEDALATTRHAGPEKRVEFRAVERRAA